MKFAKLKMDREKDRGKRVLRFFLLVFGSLFFAIFLTFILPLLLLPLVVYRHLVQLLAKWFRPDLSHILCGGDGVLALENPSRPRTNIVASIVIDGHISLDQLTKGVDEWILQKKRIKTGVETKTGRPLPLYPELKQYPWSTFMNYPFWTHEKNFEISEHVRIPMQSCKNQSPVEILSEDELRLYIAKLLSEPWTREFSPWEFLLLQNYQGNSEKTAVISRFHHVLGDGITWLHILLSLTTNDGVEHELPKFSQESSKRRGMHFMSLLFLPLKLSYDVIENTIESWDRSDEKCWNSPRNKKSRKYFLCLSQPFDVDLIKELKNKMGVKYLTVLIAAISGGIRRVMEEAGQKVPETMASYIAIPWPNHPEGITFHAAGINITWPVGTIDVRKRLDFVQRNLDEKKSSLYPLFIFYGAKIQNYLPNVILRMVSKHVLLSTLITSHMPGPVSSHRCFGKPLVEVTFTCGLPVGNPGAFIAIFGVGGKQRVAMTIDQSIFPSDEGFQKLSGYIQDELQCLKNMKV